MFDECKQFQSIKCSRILFTRKTSETIPANTKAKGNLFSLQRDTKTEASSKEFIYSQAPSIKVHKKQPQLLSQLMKNEGKNKTNSKMVTTGNAWNSAKKQALSNGEQCEKIKQNIL